MTDSCVHSKQYFPLKLCSRVWIGYISFPSSWGPNIKISKEVYLYPCVLIAQVAKVYPPPPPCSIRGNWHEEASSQSPSSCNWIMSDDAFYTVIDWFILRLWQYLQSADTSISVYLPFYLSLFSRLEQSLAEKYGYFILINSLAGIMSL